MSSLQKLSNIQVLISEHLRLITSLHVLSPCVCKVLLRYLVLDSSVWVPIVGLGLPIDTRDRVSSPLLVLVGCHVNEVDDFEVPWYFDVNYVVLVHVGWVTLLGLDFPLENGVVVNWSPDDKLFKLVVNNVLFSVNINIIQLETPIPLNLTVLNHLQKVQMAHNFLKTHDSMVFKQLIYKPLLRVLSF